ncbi:MAG: UbiA prenyltransferase family protein, partial [Gemmatimonadota bacterium]|nr:UbiA prenyltransferase family protein [Gemmatimonadota bacterium]
AQDRRHPAKRFRPIASGRLTPRHALIAAFALLVFGLGIAAVVRPLFLATASGYVALMVAYTFWFKRIVLVDVFVIAGGFVLRAVAGAVAVTVPISPWLLLCTMLLALFLGFCKRRHEITLLGHGATAHRETLAVYSPRLLDQFIATSAASTIVAYSIYTFDAPAVPPNNAMMLTIPFVAFAVYRYLVLVYRHRQGGNPEWLLLRDRPLLAAIAGWAVASVLVLYVS